MSQIKFNDQLFDVSIESNDIVLSNLNGEYHFKEGYKAMRKEAEAVYYKGPVQWIENTRLSDFIHEYIDDNVETWVNKNQDKAYQVIYNNN